MLRALSLLLLLSLSACSKSGELATIEDAEAYAQARGVVLTGKKENQGQVVAQRSYRYSANTTVTTDILQFATANAATTWKTTMDGLPLGGDTRIPKGPVVFVVCCAADAERQKVIDALK